MDIFKSITSLQKLTTVFLLFNLSNCLAMGPQVNLLELDEDAGKALMAQIMVEAKALKTNFDITYAGIPNVNLCFFNHANCPTLANLVKAIVIKADLPKDFNWTCIGMKDRAIACQVECNSHLAGNLAGNGLTIGYDVLEMITYPELIALLAHEIGHIKLQHLDTIASTKLITDCLVLALYTSYAHYNNVYSGPTVWGNIKNHFKFSFSAKGLAASIPLTLAQSYIKSYVNQRAEYQADRFSYETVNQPTALINGINKLDNINIIKNPSAMKIAHAMQVIGLSTHPATEKRAAYLAKLAKTKQLNQKKLMALQTSN